MLCHVEALRFRQIMGAELEGRDQHAALIPQMSIEGEAPLVGFDHLTGLALIPGIGMIESAQRLHLLLQRDSQLFAQRQQEVQPQAPFSPLGGNVSIERCIWETVLRTGPLVARVHCPNNLRNIPNE